MDFTIKRQGSGATHKQDLNNARLAPSCVCQASTNTAARGGAPAPQHQQPAKSQDSLPTNWKPLDSKTKSPHCFTPLELYFTRKTSFFPEWVLLSCPSLVDYIT